MIQTARLQLIPSERQHSEAFQRGKPDLAALLGVALPDGWPTFPEAFIPPPPDAPAPPAEWLGYFFIDPQEKTLVGNGGFTGQPDASGTVEIGYEIATAYQNRGFATEAARGLLDYAFAQPQVNAVIAHTLAAPNASNNVLQKIGMTFDAELPEPELGTIWRWRITRPTYESLKS